MRYKEDCKSPVSFSQVSGASAPQHKCLDLHFDQFGSDLHITGRDVYCIIQVLATKSLFIIFVDDGYAKDIKYELSLFYECFLT